MMSSKDFSIVEVLEIVAVKGSAKFVPVELKGFNLLRTTYAGLGVAMDEIALDEKSIIKKAGFIAEGKSPFDMKEENDIDFGLTVETGHSSYSRKLRTFVCLAKPRTVQTLTEEGAKEVIIEDLF